MKIILFLLIPMCFVFSCDTQNTTKTNSSATKAVIDDIMPKNQKKFLSKFTKISMEYSTYSNVYQRNKVIEDFEKYVKDTIKKAKDWVMIIDNINDAPNNEAVFAKILYGMKDNIYNLQMYSAVTKDDNISFADTSSSPLKDKWYFTYSVIKKPKKQPSINIVNTLKRLKAGDTVLVSGYPTSIGMDGKINYSLMIGAGHPNDAFDFLLETIKLKN